MHFRRSIVVAGGLTAALLAGSAALAVNLGVLDRTSTKVGRLDTEPGSLAALSADDSLPAGAVPSSSASSHPRDVNVAPVPATAAAAPDGTAAASSPAIEDPELVAATVDDAEPRAAGSHGTPARTTGNTGASGDDAADGGDDSADATNGSPRADHEDHEDHEADEHAAGRDDDD